VPLRGKQDLDVLHLVGKHTRAKQLQHVVDDGGAEAVSNDGDVDRLGAGVLQQIDELRHDRDPHAIAYQCESTVEERVGGGRPKKLFRRRLARRQRLIEPVDDLRKRPLCRRCKSSELRRFRLPLIHEGGEAIVVGDLLYDETVGERRSGLERTVLSRDGIQLRLRSGGIVGPAGRVGPHPVNQNEHLRHRAPRMTRSFISTMAWQV